jgi:hypothetical protein
VSVAERRPALGEVGNALANDRIVSMIVERFGRLIGSWADDPSG